MTSTWYPPELGTGGFLLTNPPFAPMTDDISPAAQAVLDAMHRSYDHEPTRRAIAAAVLRVAAKELRKAYANEEYIDHPDDWLVCIAAELDGEQ